MKRLMIVVLITLGVAGCKPGTEITASWKNNNTDFAARAIDKILITALTSRTTARQSVENDLASALQEKGYSTIKSMDILPPTFTDGKVPDKTVLLSKIDETGADAILTVALIDEQTESRYVPGNYSYAPVPRFGYYGTFWGYYNTWYPTLHSPGYYEEDKVYFVETNLYDARTEQLLWSAQSETINPANLREFAHTFSDVVVSKMEEDGILRKGGPSQELAREPEQQ